MAYFIGIGWYLFCEILYHIEGKHKINTHNLKTEYFHSAYDFDDMDHSKAMLSSMYFAFTSLSTVGFGDYYPKNSMERIVCVVIIFSG